MVARKIRRNEKRHEARHALPPVEFNCALTNERIVTPSYNPADPCTVRKHCVLLLRINKTISINKVPRLN